MANPHSSRWSQVIREKREIKKSMKKHGCLVGGKRRATKDRLSAIERYTKPIQPLISAESWKLQTLLPSREITMGKSRFNWTLKITAAPKIWRLFWNVTGSSKLAAAVGDRPLVKVEIMYVGETRSHLSEFNVLSAEFKSVYNAATTEERDFLRGLGRRSLCYMLQKMKRELPIAAQGYVSLFPLGEHRKGFDTSKLEAYYSSLGFIPNPRADEEDDENMIAPFSVLLKNCGSEAIAETKRTVRKK